MSRKNEKPSIRRHVLVYNDDWAFLEAYYGKANGASGIGTGAAVRQIINTYVMRLKAKLESEMEAKASRGPS